MKNHYLPTVYSPKEGEEKRTVNCNAKINNECRLDLDGTVFRFFISSKGYDDGGYFWTDAVIAVENWCFKYKTSNEFLEFHELIHIRDKLSQLLKNEISSVEVLEFIEPDLQITLNPQFDLRETGKYLYIRKGYEIADILADFKFSIFIKGVLTEQHYVLSLNRDEIAELVEYMNAAIERLSTEE